MLLKTTTILEQTLFPGTDKFSHLTQNTCQPHQAAGEQECSNRLFRWLHVLQNMEVTFPISEAQEMEIWFGTADDSLTWEVIFKGRPGRFCSIPFFGGGAYPCGKKDNGCVTQTPHCTQTADTYLLVLDRSMRHRQTYRPSRLESKVNIYSEKYQTFTVIYCRSP